MVPKELYNDIQIRLEKCEDELQDLKTFNEKMVYNIIYNNIYILIDINNFLFNLI